MIFNSIEFALFLVTVFIVYWSVAKEYLKAQNILLLIASYVFYGFWDWRFLFLLISISVFNHFLGIIIDNNVNNRSRTLYFYVGLVLNITILGIFKYYNFFIDGFISMANCLGYRMPKSTVRIILPLGISFYIFLSLSYLIDIYKSKINAHRNIIEVLLSLSFFPIILAGPIQRPSSLLPQIINKREFIYEKAVDGLRQILWGLFVKVVIADNLASYVNDIFLNYTWYAGSTLALGACFYAIQIYTDFSGYSNMAIGIAKLFGFTLMRNFAFPYFSRDITEFWKRWHISLTEWFRDYVFLPISFALSWRTKRDSVVFLKTDLFIYLVASLLTWFLTGLWHGANYTFIVWGMIHGFFLIIYQFQKSSRKKLFKRIGLSNNNSVLIIIETIITLVIVVLAWVFFRSESIDQALLYISNIFSLSLFSIPEVLPKKLLLLTILFFLTEWLQRNKQHALQLENVKLPVLRWGFYMILIIIVLSYGNSQQEFLYFKF
jgi:alginate O-acetyltransferase complex protein AlgI